MGLKVTSLSGLTKLQQQIFNLPKDDKVMLDIHTTFKDYMDKYVPFDKGFLASSATAYAQYVQYAGPYAHYMYNNIVYGPNIPKFDEQGNLIGFVSPPDKYPTGETFNYSTKGHPDAGPFWDKKMIEREGKQFNKSVEKIILQSLKERK